MDTITEAAIEDALELLKVGKKAEARAILIPLTIQNPNIPDSWYLLGFTVNHLDEKVHCFQQVLRIDPSNQAAQKQLAKLMHLSPDAHFAKIAKSVVISPKKPKKNRKLTIALILIGMVIIATFFGGAFYLYNGISMNKQANDLFVKHQCAELVQYNSFQKVFPRSLFSSFFSVYQQIDECQTQLALADAASLQDWANAYRLAENYLAQYPHGTFTQEVSEYAGNILLAWSRGLLSQMDYAAAIQKLEIIQSSFAGTSANSTAIQAMLDDYLLWGRYSLAQKDYESAEKSLKIVALSAKASLLQVKQANDDLVLVYLAWGNAHIANGEYAEGIASYDNAKALNPTLTDYDRIKTEASLTQAAALTHADDFDQALNIVNGLLSSPISNENKTDAIAEKNKIFAAYANSNSLQAQAQMARMATNLCKGQLTRLPIFGTNADVIRFTVVPSFLLQLPNNLMAVKPAELHNVVCIKQSYVTIESCDYQRGYVANRNYHVWEVSLYDITTGKLYQTNRFIGSTPRVCGDTEAFDEKTRISAIYGDTPKAQEVVDWLTGLDIAK